MADAELDTDDLAHDDAASADAASSDAALAVAARHALHDEELVAALATGSLEEAAEVHRAQALVDRCSACRELHRDLTAIGAALRIEAKGTMPAPRDFRLTVEDAHRLGGRVVVRGFLSTFRRSLESFARPVGASLAALGMVGVLVGSAALGGAGSSAISAGTDSAVATSAPEWVQAGGEQTGGPKSSGRNGAYGPDPSAYATLVTATPLDRAAAEPNSALWLLGGSVGLLVAGLALLVIALGRNRHGEAPPKDS